MVWNELDLYTIDLLRSPPKTEHFVLKSASYFCPVCHRHHFNCELLWFASDGRSLAFSFCKVTSLSVLLISYGLSPAVVFARKIKHLHWKASPFSLLFQRAAFSLCASLDFFLRKEKLKAWFGFFFDEVWVFSIGIHCPSGLLNRNQQCHGCLGWM